MGLQIYLIFPDGTDACAFSMSYTRFAAFVDFVREAETPAAAALPGAAAFRKWGGWSNADLGDIAAYLRALFPGGISDEDFEGPWSQATQARILASELHRGHTLGATADFF